MQCLGLTSKGSRCLRVLSAGKHCYQHTPLLKAPQARQQHGFDYQDLIARKYHLSPYISQCPAYTAPFDQSFQGIPVQIKTKKGRPGNKNLWVDLADYFRQKSLTHDKFILVLGIWYYQPSEIKEEYIWLIERKDWVSLFDYDYDKELKQDLTSISNKAEDDFKWRMICMKHRMQWGCNRPVQLLGRRDRGSQKRWQCSITLDRLKQFPSFSFAKK